ncbi:3-keto-5-aminohexanoate cleavage protein [Cohaesibacter sp. CAU 1516]|uniref:3-keto-5-aminohexanoate cleavage protein n=1 Tax=Cohaesibacter sp. CAU 1516 TaxID=2576038 RepID=UPI001AED5408|nr:3-keto-5-aminohexanoate cleavage protein [Cohaesibacter sp. CAU 1516]
MTLSSIQNLPTIMVAPNGARRTKADHPALPITITEVVATAKACQEAGADGLHAHVRDAEGRHVLDSGLYKELLAELAHETPDLYVQITTEAVGIYNPEQQRALVRSVQPKAVSISIREMLSDGDNRDILRFYHDQWHASSGIQHILYGTDDIALLQDLCQRGIVPKDDLKLLFVLGRYTAGQVSSPDDLLPFLEAQKALDQTCGAPSDWACCAFGQAETDCLARAVAKGGKVRIGFENNLHHSDGSLARDNADRVAHLRAALAHPA